jgi:beta-galactosidase
MPNARAFALFSEENNDKPFKTIAVLRKAAIKRGGSPMKTVRKILCFALALCLLAGLMPALAAEAAANPPLAAASASNGVYHDVDGHWAQAAIETWSESGVVKGYGDGQFYPDGAITRGEMAQLIANLLKLSARAENTFADLDDAAWYTDAVLKCAAAGILLGDGVGMRPADRITRQEAMSVLARTLRIQPAATGALSGFADGAEVRDWARGYVAALIEAGIVVGTGAGLLHPAEAITRAAVVKMLDSAITAYIREPGAYPVTEKTGAGIVLVVTQDAVLSGSVPGTVLIGAGAQGGAVTLNGAAAGTVVVAAEQVSLRITGFARVDVLTVEEDAAETVVSIGRNASVAAVNKQADTRIVQETAGESAAVPETVSIEGADDVTDLKTGADTTRVLTTDPADAVISAVSGNPDAATVSVAGHTLTVAGVAAGTAEITVTARKDGYADGTATFRVIVTDPVVITIEGADDVADLKTGADTTRTLTTDPADAEISAVSGNPDAATVSVAGHTLTVIGVAAGTAVITVTAQKDGYASGTAAFRVIVTDPVVIAIEGADDVADLKTGADTTRTLTTDPADAVISAVSGNPDAAIVSVAGHTLTITGVAAGTAEITVTAQKDGYADGTAAFRVTVTEEDVLSRQVFNFNADWKFSKGNGYVNSESSRGAKTELVVLPKDDKPYEADYVMGGTWTDVSLPHTYNDVDTFDNFTESGHNGERSVYGGTAWYKKTFTIPAAYAGKKIFLEFEAARQGAEVYLNGVKLEGKSENGFIPFGYDLTAGIRFGEENDITVMTDNSFPYYHIGEDGSKNELSWADSHWHPNSGGLYRNATLYVTDPLHVTLPLYSFLETQGTYVYTENETRTAADVVMEAEIANEGSAARTFTYAAEVLDADGQVVFSQTSASLTLEPGDKQVFSLTGTLQNPKRWSTEYPYLYQVVSKVLVNGKELDRAVTPLGVRTFRFTNDSGFFLNENYVKLQGWGQKPTDEWAGLGAAYPDWMHAFTQELMKGAGGNFIRWGHSAGSPTQIAVSDQYGIVTLQPGVDGEGSTVGGTYSQLSYAVRKDAFRDMLIYFRNNPSILLWELGNQSMPDAEAKALSDLIYQYDGHGMTAAEKKNSGAYNATETASNRLIAVRRGDGVMSKYIDVSVTTEGGWELKSAGKPGVEGEYNREEARRGVWDRYTPGFESYKTANGSSYNLTTEEYAVNQAANYAKISASDHSGGANWIFSDSTSHGRVYSEVSRVSGEVDAVRLPKEAYYTIKTIFNDAPDVYLVGHWNYPAGTVKDVYATSNAASVKLLVTAEGGGTTEYTGTKSNGYVFTFKNVAYTPGTATAIAYDRLGAEVARSVKRTHGAAVALRLTPIAGPEGLLANGSDILLLDVEAVDADGNRCLTFDGTINGKITTFEINDGNGSSVWRGGYNSGIEGSTNKKTLYLEAGINRVAVRTTMKPGDITVTARTDGLAEASITVASAAIDNTGGLNSARSRFRLLALETSRDPGVGSGEKPAEDAGTVTEQKSALIGEFFYTGSDALTKIAFPAIRGAQVYSDDKYIQFGELPIALLNSEYLQLPQEDANLLGATDLIQLSFQRDVNLYIAHDDAIDPMPGWFAENGYADTGMDITVNGKTHSVYQKAFLKDTSATLFSNVDGAHFVTGGNQYVVFVKEQGQEKAFLMDDFEGQAAEQPPLGWMVSLAENTSANIADAAGNKVLELLDTNTGSAPNMAVVSRKFLPQSGKFSLEYKIYDYDQAVSGKAQDYVRIFLTQGPPSTDPNNHTGTVLESYLRSGSSLEGRQEYPTRVDVKIKTLTKETWYTVKYIVDVAGQSYDVYVDGVLQKTGIKFRNNLPYVDHLVLGSGGSYGTHVLIDDVKIELIDNALSGIAVNGSPLSGFAAETLAYSQTLPVGTTEAPAVTATARDQYAAVAITQAEGPTGAAAILVTALNGDKRTYTVQFSVASAVNTVVDAISLDGVPLKRFDADSRSYSVILPPEAAWPAVTVTKLYETDDVRITGSGTSAVTVTVNGAGIYTLNFTKAAYALNGFGALDGSVWTKGPDGSSSIDETGVVTLADSTNKGTFLWGRLDQTYDDGSLADKKIVMEWDVKPVAGQQWIRSMLMSAGEDNKAYMVDEFYIHTTAGAGNLTYKASNGASANTAFTPALDAGTAKNGEWNHIRVELSTDTRIYTVTVSNSGGTKTGATAAGTGIVRNTDGNSCEISYVHFGTGGGATGNVQYKDVKVYVCSDY